MPAKNLTISALLALLLTFALLGCAEDTETPTEASQLLPETPALTTPGFSRYTFALASLACSICSQLSHREPMQKTRQRALLLIW